MAQSIPDSVDYSCISDSNQRSSSPYNVVG